MDAQKQPKKLPKPIDCSECKYKCSRNFPESLREKICESFWNLRDYRRQKDFILANVKAAPPKRRRPTTEGAEVRRTNSKTFHLREKRVCQSFFLKTLSISNGPLLKAFQYKNEYTNFFDAEDRRGKHEPSNKIKPATVTAIVEFLASKCLSDVATARFRKRVISDTSYRSLRNLFNDFREHHPDAPSYTSFKRIFGEHHFSLPHERLRTLKHKLETSQEMVVVEEEQQQLAPPQVIAAEFLQSPPEVYEIQFIPIQTINAIQQ